MFLGPPRQFNPKHNTQRLIDIYGYYNFLNLVEFMKQNPSMVQMGLSLINKNNAVWKKMGLSLINKNNAVWKK